MAGVKRKAAAQDLSGRKVKGNKKSKVNSGSVKSAQRHPPPEEEEEEDSPGELVESDTTETELLEPEPFEDGSSGDLIESDTTETEVFEGFNDGNENVEEEPNRDRSRENRHEGVASLKKIDAQSVTTKGTSSKEAHAKQKAVTQERKAAKPNAPQVERSKKIWERLRRKSHVPLDERKKLVTELFTILTGRFKDFVFKHDAVRVVQTAVKYANLTQRKMIATELKGEYRSLAESKYAKFLIGKLLVHGDAEIRDMIVSEFYGQVRRLIRHPEASWILDDIYRGIATPQQKAILLREWYGPEYALFKTFKDERPTSKLSEILQASPEKRAPIMRYLFELINQLVQKKSTAFTMLHDAMLQYFSNVQTGSEEMRDFIDLLGSDEDGDLLKNMAFTKSGSKVVSLCLAYGTAKDRKHIIRTYKDIIQMMSYDQSAHTILLTSYEVVDDTKFLSKTIISGLFGKEDTVQDENIMNAVGHLYGRILYLYLPAGRAKWLLSPEEIEFLEDVDQIRSSTSKKDPGVRKQELLDALSPPLLRTVEKSASVLSQSSFGCQFITEVLLGCVGDKTKALKAIAELAEGPSAPDDLICSVPGGRMLKTLVLGGHFDAKQKRVKVIEPPLNFHEIFYDHIKPRLMEWATGPNSFVIVGLLEADGFTRKKEVLKTLKDHVRMLESASKSVANGDANGNKQSENQKPEEGDDDGKGRKKKKRKEDENTGNKGAALLLEKLR